MKFGFVKAGFLAFVSILISACGGKNADDAAPGISLAGYEYDYIVQLPDSLAMDGEEGKYVRVSGQGVLPEKIGGHEMEFVRDSLMRLGGVAKIEGAKAKPILLPGYALTELDPHKDAAGSTRYNELTVTLVTPRIVVWRDYAYSYLFRSAHGVYNTTFVNYSIPQRKILQMSDLFKAGSEESLASLLRSKLEDDEVELSVPLNEVGVPNDFEITENGIRFVYALYEIAPYVEGEVAVELESYQLSELLQPGVEDLLWQRIE